MKPAAELRSKPVTGNKELKSSDGELPSSRQNLSAVKQAAGTSSDIKSAARKILLYPFV